MLEKLKNIFMFGLVLIPAISVVGGAGYLAFWVCCVGGIIQIINGFTADPINATWVAVGFLRFMSTWIIFWLSFIVFGVLYTGYITLIERWLR